MSQSNELTSEGLVGCSHRKLVEAVMEDDPIKMTDELTEYGDYNFPIKFDSSVAPWMLSAQPPLVSVVCFLGALDCLDVLINLGVKLNNTDKKARTVPTFACAGGKLEVLRVLKQNNVNFYYLDSYGNNCCHYAAKYMSFDVIAYLFSVGTSLVQRNERGATPFMWACSNGSIDIAKFIYENAKVNVNEKTFGRWTPLHYAASKDNNKKVIDFLLSKDDIDMNIIQTSTLTPLGVAADKGITDSVQILLDAGALLKEGTGKNGPVTVKHPIFQSLSHLDVFKLFLTHPRSVKEIDQNDMDILLDRSRDTSDENYLEIIKMIVDFINENPSKHPKSGLEEHFRRSIAVPMPSDYIKEMMRLDQLDLSYVRDSDFRNFVHFAVDAGSVENLKLVLARNVADVNQRNSDGSTPLLSALGKRKNAKEVVEALLECEGIDVAHGGKKRANLVDVARKKKGLAEIVPLLEARAKAQCE